MAIMPKDPVCGMEIAEAEAAGKSEYKGTIYYFCAPGCKRAFDKDPQPYMVQLPNHRGLLLYR